MLNLERLGNITAELSSSLVRSIVLPGGLFGRLTNKAERAPRAEATPVAPRPDESGRPYLPAGTVLLSGRPALAEDAVVACIRHAGGRNIRVVVVPAGAAEPAGLFQEVARPFIKYGIKEIEMIDVSGPGQADRPDTAERIEQAHVVLLCGDDAGRAQAALQGTAVHAAMIAALAQNRVLVGAGPAAALLADRFLVPGPGGESVLHPGLGLLPRVVLPAGFDPMQGHSRLLHAVGCQVGALFLGISLDSTASLVVRESEARVAGEGSVTFMDGREASCVPEETMTGQCTVPVSSEQPPLCGLKVHVLVAGYGLNLKNRRPMGPPRDHLQVAGG